MDVTKTEILIMLAEGTIPPSVKELSERTGKATGTIHDELQELVKSGMVTGPVKKGMARSYTITDMGMNYLMQNGHMISRPANKVFRGFP